MITIRIPREKNAARHNPRLGDTCLMYNGNYRGEGDITHFSLTVTGVTKTTLLVSYLDEEGDLIENEDISIGVWAHARGSSDWKMGHVTHYEYVDPKETAFHNCLNKMHTAKDMDRVVVRTPKMDAAVWAPYVR